MATFLQLAQRLRLDAGISGTGPFTVAGNTNNEYARVCNWINAALLEILLSHDRWKFMYSEFSLTCTPGLGEYTPAQVVAAASLFGTDGIALYDADEFRYYPAGSTNASEQFMRRWPWTDFRSRYRFGPARTQQGVPTDVSYDRAKRLQLWPIPSAAHVVTGAFWRAARPMVADTDTPPFPEEFHLLPVYWALTKYAGFEEASSVYQHAQNQIDLLYPQLERQELEENEFPDPLA